MILVFQLNQQYMIGLTQEPFDTNDDGRTEGWRDRVKFRDAIASKKQTMLVIKSLLQLKLYSREMDVCDRRPQ